MNDNNNAPATGGEAAPAQNQPQQNQAPTEGQQIQQQPTRAPRNDAEAAAFDAQAKEQAAKAAQGKQPNSPDAATDGSDGKKPNRTTEYINKINQDRARLQRELDDARRGTSGQQQPQQSSTPRQQGTQAGAAEESAPTLEDFDFDLTAYTAAMIERGVSNALKARDTAQQQVQSTESFTKEYGSYLTRIHEFSEAHPDFQEVVDSMSIPVSEAVQHAIIRHEKGPALAYHIATNEDAAYELAQVPPHLVDVAIKRIAARLDAAPAAADPANPNPDAGAQGAGAGQGASGNGAQPNAPTNTQAAPAAKQLSNAPAPAPTLGGRATVDTPSEKLTDDQWYTREKERARKR